MQFRAINDTWLIHLSDDDGDDDDDDDVHQLAGMCVLSHSCRRSAAYYRYVTRHDLGTLDVQLDGNPADLASSWEVAAAEGSAENGPATIDFFPTNQPTRRGRLVGQ